MQVRKLKADKIFDGYNLLTGKVLLINEDRSVENIVDEKEAGEGIEKFDGILTPGFINCHCHLELSHLKGIIPEKTGLVDFVFKVVNERYFPEDEILSAIETAENEMIKNGIVAVGDICNNTLTLQQKRKEQINYYNFIEASGWLPSIAPSRLDRAKQIFKSYSDQKLKIKKAFQSIVPHAPYSVSKNLWLKIQPFFERKVVTIHNQETVFEDTLFKEGKGDFERMYELMKIDNAHFIPTGKSSIASYFHHLTRASNILLVHNTFTTQTDIDFIKEKQSRNNQTFFCLCINANKYIEDALPPIELFKMNQLQIVLGTDSLASNWSLNILDEIKTIRSFFPGVSLVEMLQWATSNGAKALGMDDLLGSFEKGKKPGIILVNEETLAAQRLI